MNNALIVLRKEWRELIQQRLLVLTVFLPPLILTLLPLLTIGQVGSMSLASASAFSPLYPGLSPRQAVEAMTASQFALFYFLLPAIITSVIASYSIVGEKTSRTLEPILATPIRTWELLVGKCLGSLVPGVGATWLGAMVFTVGLLAETDRQVVDTVVSPGWIVLCVVWAPLLSFIAIAAMVAVSSRVNDQRTAQQSSAWLIIPFLTLFFSRAAGVQMYGLPIMLAGTAALLALAVLSLGLASRIFQREAILTRWK